MKSREKELERALAGFEQTGDDELDALAETADQLARHFAVTTPSHPRSRAMFIAGASSRKRSFMSSLAVPAIAMAGLLIFIGVIGRTAAPGDSLYPVRQVLRSAGLATSPTVELQRELDEASFQLSKAQAAFDRGEDAEPFAVSVLMRLGRAEGYLDDVETSDRVRFEGLIADLEARAVTLIRLGATLPVLDDNGGQRGDSGEDGSGTSEGNPGTGSDDSGSDDSGGSDGDSDNSSGSGSDSDNDLSGSSGDSDGDLDDGSSRSSEDSVDSGSTPTDD